MSSVLLVLTLEGVSTDEKHEMCTVLLNAKENAHRGDATSRGTCTPGRRVIYQPEANLAESIDLSLQQHRRHYRCHL